MCVCGVCGVCVWCVCVWGVVRMCGCASYVCGVCVVWCVHGVCGVCMVCAWCVAYVCVYIFYNKNNF